MTGGTPGFCMGSRLAIMWFVRTTESEAAAAARIGARAGARKRRELLCLLRPCFARPEPWLQAGKYVNALLGGLPKRNGWTIAEHAGDRAPDRTQRLLNRATWDTVAAMGTVRRFAVTGLDEAACRSGRRRGLVIGALDETGQEKQGEATAGVQRQYLGCAGRVANGINTVHLAYVREHAGHALIGSRQWIPRTHIDDPVKALAMGLPLDLEFRTKGQLAIDISADALADGIRFDFFCGDEVYGNCTELRTFFETRGQAYVLRVPRNFRLTLASGRKLTCADAASLLLAGRHPEIRSAGKDSKGERWYAWSWLAAASPQHCLLIRRHLKTGELAFHLWQATTPPTSKSTAPAPPGTAARPARPPPTCSASSAASSSPPDLTHLALTSRHPRKSTPSAWPGKKQWHNGESRVSRERLYRTFGGDRAVTGTVPFGSPQGGGGDAVAGGFGASVLPAVLPGPVGGGG